jgi:hypothetical protein
MINYMDIKEFADTGYLQEVNRLFFHPLGLALEVVEDADGDCRLGGIWDYRDDPEGIIFEDVDPVKVERVREARVSRSKARRDALGYTIQPEMDEDDA